MSNDIDKINELIKNYFGQNLVSLAIFGSSCRRKKFRITSDLDYIIILKNLKKPQDKISRSLKNKLRNIFPLVAFNIYSRDNFIKILENNAWFVLTIKLGYKIYFDKNNFFKEILKNHFRILKQRKVGRLSWYIKNTNFKEHFKNHYLQLAGYYLQAARLLHKNQLINIALELLLNSAHCFMINKLLDKKIFITKGEISQLFFNIYSDHKILKFRNTFLQLEQIVNQKYSFNFDRQGNMIFLKKNNKKNKLFFIKAVGDFEKLQIFFKHRI
jgi:predicted nucleotidyltransferase